MSLSIDLDGYKLAAEILGQPEGAPWIVLSNSLAASWQMWKPQLEWLGKRYRILAYDTRGHGASDAPPGPYTLAGLADDVIAAMDQAGIAKASYMGLSLGGMTGLGLALNHPERFERMVCCDARAEGTEAFVKSWDDRMATVDKGGLEVIAQSTLERWLVPQFRKANPDVVADLSRMIVTTSVAGYKGCAAALKGLDYQKHLGKITIPMIYVVGAQDTGTPPEPMRAMAAATPGALFFEIPDAAHLSNIDNAAAFNQAIGPFLGLS